VPESVLKKRKAREELRATAVAERKKEKAAGKTRRAGMLKRAEQYVKEYRATERATIEARRAARSTGDYFLDPEAKLAIVVRIRGINGVSPKVRRILQLLRLRQIHNATFVRVNKANLQMLQLIKPYIAWGYVIPRPTAHTAATSIHARTHAVVAMLSLRFVFAVTLT
jgi:large subunit ribosomal protein L7e